MSTETAREGPEIPVAPPEAVLPAVRAPADLAWTIVQMRAGERITVNEGLIAAYQAASSPHSIRALKSDVEAFDAWCRRNNRIALPATPETTDLAELFLLLAQLLQRLAQLFGGHAVEVLLALFALLSLLTLLAAGLATSAAASAADLLDLSYRPLAGKQQVNLQPVVDRVLEGHAADIAAARTAVHLRVEPMTLQLDREGMAVVLRNLVGNALKFSRPGEPPRVEIGARREATTHLIWVRDHGVGFDMKYHDRIFGIFQRLQRAEDYPGTGVGLALVSKAVQRMGGRVWAESQPGQGATFFMEFPL